MANSVDLKEQSDLRLHCLPRPVCPDIKDHYGNNLLSSGLLRFSSSRDKVILQELVTEEL